MNAKITGLILSGGRALRMDSAGNVDKGLVKVCGTPLIAHVITRLAPQVDSIIINANRHLAEYATLGYTVLTDDNKTDFMGPLAGLAIAMQHISTPLIAMVPCDAPRLPHDLVSRLASALTNNCDLAYAMTSAQPQPTFCVLKTSLGDDLTAYLASGERSIQHWIAALGMRAAGVAFDADVNAFININTVDDVSAFERQYCA
jgi:molybdenum cofactor guanylyltransferase